jgi:hypothetical protein
VKSFEKRAAVLVIMMDYGGAVAEESFEEITVLCFRVY